ncbi:hypothetical protein BHYA_0081g00020 [Botrytis hyacinthi]|uniref:Uncharacterized protein n=1 Tax=Botrytis hyacinthi TaxID=278943 RepID=A0A4Z1GTH2_9HELO|nr:hypothetical protein BHYA_0081g00020 [Botrytis hyacinthi]
MSAQLEYNSQANEAAQENDFPEGFDDLFNKEYEKLEAAAPAPALAFEQEAAAAAVLAPEPQVENGQVDEDAEHNGFGAEFYMEFEETFEKEQRNAAPAPVAPAPQLQANDMLVQSLGIFLTTAEIRARARAREQWYIEGASHLLGLVADANRYISNY